jgi:hypothetical protein
VGSTVVAEGLGFVSLAANNVSWEKSIDLPGDDDGQCLLAPSPQCGAHIPVPAGAPLGVNKVYAEEAPQVFVATTFTVQ